MKYSTFIVNKNAATIVLGFVGSVLIGALLTGRAVLDWTSPAFQYLVYGAGTAILFVVWKKWGFLESTMYALSFALFCAIPVRLFAETFANSALFFLFACCSFPLVWNHLGRRLRMGRSVLLGFLFAVFELIKTPFIGLVLSSGDILVATSINTVLGGTIGFGVGLGIEIAASIFRSSWMRHLAGPNLPPED